VYCVIFVFLLCIVYVCLSSYCVLCMFVCHSTKANKHTQYTVRRQTNIHNIQYKDKQTYTIHSTKTNKHTQYTVLVLCIVYVCLSSYCVLCMFLCLRTVYCVCFFVFVLCIVYVCLSSNTQYEDKQTYTIHSTKTKNINSTHYEDKQTYTIHSSKTNKHTQSLCIVYVFCLRTVYCVFFVFLLCIVYVCLSSYCVLCMFVCFSTVYCVCLFVFVLCIVYVSLSSYCVLCMFFCFRNIHNTQCEDNQTYTIHSTKTNKHTQYTVRRQTNIHNTQYECVPDMPIPDSPIFDGVHAAHHFSFLYCVFFTQHCTKTNKHTQYTVRRQTNIHNTQ
jgi:cell division protein YceG involved in septum cleavage